AMAARPVIPERAALAATLLAEMAATAATAATAGRLMAATLLVAMAVRAPAAAGRPAEEAGGEEGVAAVGAAAAWRGRTRVAAGPVIPGRGALAATLLADGAATAATAATAGRLMAATLLVAMAVLEAAMAARRSEDLAGPEEMAAMVAPAASWRGTRRSETP